MSRGFNGRLSLFTIDVDAASVIVKVVQAKVPLSQNWQTTSEASPMDHGSRSERRLTHAARDAAARRCKRSGQKRSGEKSGWARLYDWRQVDRQSAMTLSHQVYLQVRAAILSGGLSGGTRLPSSRELASRLEVARMSVIAAYEQLFAEGYVTARTGSGTFVSAALPDDAIERSPARRRSAPVAASKPACEKTDEPAYSDARPFNLGRTLVDDRAVDAWRRLVRQAARSLGPQDLGYSDPGGLPALREAICRYLQAARAVRCEPGQIVITAGTQHGIDIATRVLLRPGDPVWVEDPGYPLTRDALAAAGMRVCPVPVDEHGLRPGAGLKIAHRARAACVTPSHQYPLGVVLTMARRLELLAWARDNDAWIIEDDYVSEFRYSGLPLASLQGLDDSDRVVYVGTFNKALFPGLRLGYLVAPWPIQRAFVEARHLMDRRPPSLIQSVVAEFMAQGHFASHIRRMRLQYKAQRDALADALARHAGDAVIVNRPDQGMHLVAGLREGNDLAVERAAGAGGLVARALSRTYVKARPQQGLLLGFSGYPAQAIAPAAARLGKIIRCAGP
jgi:GntR family transcriptional regulator/MocR family aminotransferase